MTLMQNVTEQTPAKPKSFDAAALATVLDAIPSPAMVLDRRNHVTARNARMRALLAADHTKPQRLRQLASKGRVGRLTPLPNGYVLVVMSRPGIPEHTRLLAARWKATARELDVLELLREGLSTRAIAARLEVGPRTVESHVSRLLEKSECESRAEIIARLWQTALESV